MQYLSLSVTTRIIHLLAKKFRRCGMMYPTLNDGQHEAAVILDTPQPQPLNLQHKTRRSGVLGGVSRRSRI